VHRMDYLGYIISQKINPSVLDPSHLDRDTDPGPWIRTLDYGSGSSLLISFFFYLFFFLLTVGTVTVIVVFKDNKSFRNHKTVQIKVFLNFFMLVDGGIRILYYVS
jgi:hypothetical protein